MFNKFNVYVKIKKNLFSTRILLIINCVHLLLVLNFINTVDINNEIAYLFEFHLS